MGQWCRGHSLRIQETEILEADGESIRHPFSRSPDKLYVQIYVIPFIVFGLFVAVAVNVRYSALQIALLVVTHLRISYPARN